MSTQLQQRESRYAFLSSAEHDWGHGSPTPPDAYHARLLRRFWAKVDKTPGLGPWGDCWEWTGSKVRKYGQIGVKRPDGRQVPRHAHAAAWVYVYGHPEPPKGWHVCHKCNNKPCVREEHLFPGTPRQNVHHAMATGLIKPKQQKPQPTEFRVTLSKRQGRLIRHSREAQKISLVDLAYLADMCKSHFSRMERGQRGCRVSQIVFILNFLKINPEIFGLSKCPITTAPKRRKLHAKYRTEAPQYVYRRPLFVQHLRKQRPAWIVKLGEPRTDLYDAKTMVETIERSGIRQGEILEATGLPYLSLFTVLRGEESNDAKVSTMIRYIETLKAEKAA